MKPKRPKDMNRLAASIVAIASGGENIDNSGQIAGADTTLRECDASGKNPNAVALGRLGGKKGGRARALSLSVEQRKAIASNAAKARWTNKRDDKRDDSNGE